MLHCYLAQVTSLWLLRVRKQKVKHLRGEGGVALLPEELAGADEGRGVLKLPAHHVCPLVQPQRQVPVAAYPLRAQCTEDTLFVSSC